MTTNNRVFSVEFKHETACLVLDQNYSLQEACDAVGVSRTTARRWVEQLKGERQGLTPTTRTVFPDNCTGCSLITSIVRQRSKTAQATL